MLDHAQINEDAVFVGQGSRFQIWEPKTFEEYSIATFDRARERKATLRLKKSRDNSEGLS